MMITGNALCRVAAGIAMAVAFAWTGLAETVTNVRGIQREKSNLVDIYYDIEATDGGTYTVEVQLEGRTNEVTAATFTGDVGEGIAPGRNRHILWNAGADWPGKKGDVRAIVTATKEPEKGKPGKGVQLWEGGPYWADRNIGANKPWESGLYFWWGDTVGHRPSSDGTFGFNFSFANSAIYTYQNLLNLLYTGWVTNGVLALAHDAAHIHWGGVWRMPTSEELGALETHCDWTWTKMNGVNGYIVRGKGEYASNSIFLPCVGIGDGTSLNYVGLVGYFWSSVPDGDSYSWDNINRAYYLGFDSSGHCTFCYFSRYYGFSVRPVQGFTK